MVRQPCLLARISILAPELGSAYHKPPSLDPPKCSFFLLEPSFASAKRQFPPAGKTKTGKLLLAVPAEDFLQALRAARDGAARQGHACRGSHRTAARTHRRQCDTREPHPSGPPGVPGNRHHDHGELSAGALNGGFSEPPDPPPRIL
jgi:hypothetical protein